MNLRVTVSGKVKGHESWIRSESESEQGVKSDAVDAKPSDLPLARLKVRDAKPSDLPLARLKVR